MTQRSLWNQLLTSKLPFANGLQEFQLLSVQGPATCQQRMVNTKQLARSDGDMKWSEKRQRLRKTDWPWALEKAQHSSPDTQTLITLLINTIRPQMIANSCRRRWACLYTVCVLLTLCLGGALVPISLWNSVTSSVCPYSWRTRLVPLLFPPSTWVWSAWCKGHPHLWCNAGGGQRKRG